MAVAPTLERAAGVEPLEAAPASREARRLYERHRERIFAFCLSRLRSREDAEDAVQTTFLYAYRALERGIHPGVEIAWLLTIAKNVCRTRWDEARRRRVESTSDPHVLAESVAAEERDVPDLGPLRSALESLPLPQRQAIVLREWKGLSYREIASELGVTQAAVETMIFRARGQLADALEAAGFASGRRRLARVNGGLVAALNAIKSVASGGAGALKLAALLGAATAVVVGSGTALRSAPPAPPAPPRSHVEAGATAPPTSSVDRAAAGAASRARRAASVAGSDAPAVHPKRSGPAAGASARTTPAPPDGSASGPDPTQPASVGLVSTASKLVETTLSTAKTTAQAGSDAVGNLTGTATLPVKDATDTVKTTAGAVLTGSTPAG